MSARTAVVDPFMSRALDNLLLALVSKFVGFLLSLVLSARARCCLWKDDGGCARARFVSLGCCKVNLCCVFMGIPFLWVIAKTLNPISRRKWLELETDQFISAAADFFSCFG